MIESFVTIVVVKMATMVFVDTVFVTSCQRNDTPAVYNAVIVVVVDLFHIVSLSHTENDVVAF